jgi:hypothetical protein
MTMAVAERLHVPIWNGRFVADGRAAWAEDPLRAMLSWPALPPGPTRTRLETLMYCRPDRAVNLLPPDVRIGTWEPTTARANAFRLARWAASESDMNFFLLGRRVATAFGVGDAPVGAEFRAWGVPCLFLPHPSGRSRYLNSIDKRREIRRRVRDFAERRTLCGAALD